MAEDHQTKNAMALVEKKAAILVRDSDAPQALLRTAIDTVNNEECLKKLSQQILKLGLKDSANAIAEEVIRLAK